MNHDQIKEKLPDYALGCLENDENANISSHLAVCEVCQAQLADYRMTVDLMAFAAPQKKPSNALKTELMKKIQALPETKKTTAPTAKEKKWRFKSFQFAPAWVFASLIIIVSLVAGNLVQWQRSEKFRSEMSAGLIIVKMKGTPDAPHADGTFVISQDGMRGVLVASDLPVPAKNMQYQLWMSRDGKKSSGGVFDVTPNGYAVEEISSSKSLLSYREFDVTVEPAGGSHRPTGRVMMHSAE